MPTNALLYTIIY